ALTSKRARRPRWPGCCGATAEDARPWRGKSMMRILPLLVVSLWSLAAPAEERIVEFASEIEVRPSRELVVTEPITAVAEGREIRRGIYRDFPTRYEDRSGRRVRVPFEVVDVLRDGEREDWHTESISN